MCIAWLFCIYDDVCLNHGVMLGQEEKETAIQEGKEI